MAFNFHITSARQPPLNPALIRTPGIQKEACLSHKTGEPVLQGDSVSSRHTVNSCAEYSMAPALFYIMSILQNGCLAIGISITWQDAYGRFCFVEAKPRGALRHALPGRCAYNRLPVSPCTFSSSYPQGISIGPVRTVFSDCPTIKQPGKAMFYHNRETMLNLVAGASKLARWRNLAKSGQKPVLRNSRFNLMLPRDSVASRNSAVEHCTHITLYPEAKQLCTSTNNPHVFHRKL